MSNAVNMTLEQKLVQHIKELGLGALITDEDAITELTRKAIQEALYQRRTIKDGTYSTQEIDSPVVEAARNVANAALQKLFDERVKELLTQPAVVHLLNEALAKLLPDALIRAADMMFTGLREQSRMVIINDLMNQLRQMGVKI